MNPWISHIQIPFCGCKFLRFVSKICTWNFCDFIFYDFTPWHSEFYSLDDMKKIHLNLKHSAFCGLVHFSWNQDHFPLWSHQSTQAVTPVARPRFTFLVNKSLLIKIWPKPLVHTHLDLNYVSLDRVYLIRVNVRSPIKPRICFSRSLFITTATLL